MMAGVHHQLRDPHPCELCGGTGTMFWRQPVSGQDGVLELVEMSHPCVDGCSGWYQLPAAESGNVVDTTTTAGPATGNVAAANQIHRTEWSRPTGSSGSRSSFER
ncbi:hypothetical protein ACSHWB_35045 [Lentzea sp. HUAS TT2]|uniref:hypothetical protein n=1 Tax=Lentzea sp. HUAS TT2 TaxID=3447454 RepID=UPI003F7117FF